MNTAEILKRRAEAHAAECAGLEDDYLIQVAFGKPAPVAPAKSPMQPDFMLRRQAD
jgi:hypothetical protein